MPELRGSGIWISPSIICLMKPKLIPELDVKDLTRSLEFYVGTVGFQLLYERPEERFAFLDLDGAHLMLQEAAGPGRRFRTAPLEPPYGRGVNFQIQLDEVRALYERITAKKFTVVIPLEEKWYRRDLVELGNRQFVAADPDGYLLRFYMDLGARSLA